MKFNRFLASVLAISLISTSAMARGPGRDRPDRGDDEVVSMEKYFRPEKMKELGLTEEQIGKLKALRKEKKASAETLRGEIKEARQKFKQVMRSGSREEVRQAFQVMMAKKEQLAKSRLDNFLEARDILTDEQKAKLFSRGK